MVTWIQLTFLLFFFLYGLALIDLFLSATKKGDLHTRLESFATLHFNCSVTLLGLLFYSCWIWEKSIKLPHSNWFPENDFNWQIKWCAFNWNHVTCPIWISQTYGQILQSLQKVRINLFLWHILPAKLILKLSHNKQKLLHHHSPFFGV